LELSLKQTEGPHMNNDNQDAPPDIKIDEPEVEIKAKRKRMNRDPKDFVSLQKQPNSRTKLAKSIRIATELKIREKKIDDETTLEEIKERYLLV
jgi:hypothetical protein